MSPLRLGARRSPESRLPINSELREAGKARRIASLSAAAAVVVGVATASALFVDYLADRALARSSDAPATVKPVAAKPVQPVAETKVASVAPQAAQPSQPVEPPKVAIAVEAPDPAAIAKVAVGPEHAIELPTDDPTANPVVKTGKVPAQKAADDMPISAYAGEAADGTQTAAIDAEAPEPVVQPPVKKPKRQTAEQAKPQQDDTEIASLPGVDVGGLDGNASEDNDDGTVQTTTKQTKNLGGVPAGPARVTTAVNMRSGPKKGASALGVVPAGTAVNVISCDGWCQVSYNGRTGWVYKSFLAAGSPRAAAKPQAQQQPAGKSASTASEPDASEARKGISSRL
jgi:hypothetical protein